jgi:thiol-disulfide isomerase/thioredoxin
MKTYVITLIFALLFITVGFASGSAEDNMGSASNGSMSMGKDDTMMAPAAADFYSTKGLEPRVVPFITESAAEKLAVKGPTIYFFAASWCPNCQATMKHLRQNVSEIPRDVTIVLVNYDTQTALKQKYGITSQHAFVQINPEGKQIAIWAGSSTVDDILKHIVRGGM